MANHMEEDKEDDLQRKTEVPVEERALHLARGRYGSRYNLLVSSFDIAAVRNICSRNLRGLLQKRVGNLRFKS